MKKKNIIFLLCAVVILGVLIAITLSTPGTVDPESYTPKVYSTIGALLPPIIAIILALITKEVYSSLFVGIVAGALLYSNGNLELMLNTMLYNEEGGMIYKLADSWNVGILVFLVVLGIMVALMNKVGGSAAFGQWASTHIKTRVGAQLATMALGVLIFVDDYFNCLTVGSVMRPVTDRHQVSRAKLAYLIDATAAPVCIIAPVSSWAAAVTSSVPEGSDMICSLYSRQIKKLKIYYIRSISMSRKKYDETFKRQIIHEYETGGISCYALGQKYGVDAKCVRSWCRLYKQFGEDYFTANHANLNYSAEFKQQVVDSYLEGGKTYQSVAAEFGIFAPTTVRQWVMMYNNHEELKNSRPEGLVNMVKKSTRKTTFEERIAIVEYCIENNYNYALTAKKFEVSYGQVYSWIQKYKSGGTDGLLDRRGKSKSGETLSENERLQIEIRMLKAENRKQQMEIDFLKKLEEIERRRF